MRINVVRRPLQCVCGAATHACVCVSPHHASLPRVAALARSWAGVLADCCLRGRLLFSFCPIDFFTGRLCLSASMGVGGQAAHPRELPLSSWGGECAEKVMLWVLQQEGD